ncbi:MAG: hypothetical protein NW226_10590 [Microscillaceae bacterium]|nr:hypothetical protein [Microscillaceae bacterium]
MKKIQIILFLCLCTWVAQAQVKDSTAISSIYDQNFYWGLTFNNSWTDVLGDIEPYFMKPSLGGGFKTDYYFTKSKNIGFSAGFTYQQRGAGIKTFDVAPEALGDPDSTNRLRLRFNSFEIPLAFIFRSKNPVGKGQGVRWTGGVGITPQWVFRTTRIFFSVEDGFHIINYVTKDYAQIKASVDANFGVYINAGNSAVFQTDLLVSYGLTNILNNDALFGNEKSKDLMVGIRLSFLYSRFKL